MPLPETAASYSETKLANCAVTKYFQQPLIDSFSLGEAELSSVVGNTPVLLSGSITIAGMADAHQALLSALQSEGPLTLDISEVSEADLTFVQLIESARRSAAEADRPIALAQPADGAVREVLRRGGFLDPADADRMNFWLQEAPQS